MTITDLAIRPVFMAAAILLGIGGGVASADEIKSNDAAQFARGAKAWAQTCQGCYNLRDPKELTDRNWDIVVNHMRVRADLPGQMARDIKAFLKASN